MGLGAGDVCGALERIASLVRGSLPMSPHEQQRLLRTELLTIRSVVDDPELVAHIDTVVRAVDFFVASPEERTSLVAVDRDDAGVAAAAIDRFARERCGISTLPPGGVSGRPAGTTPPAASNEADAGVDVVGPQPVPRGDRQDRDHDPRLPVLMESSGLSQQEALEVLEVQNELSDYARTIKAHPGFVEFGLTGAGTHGHADTGMVVVEPNRDGEALRRLLRSDITVLVASRDKSERLADPAIIEAAAKVALPGLEFAASYQPFDDGYTLWVFAEELPERARERLTEELAKRGHGFLNVHVDTSTATPARAEEDGRAQP